jgi:hypothetical protein
MRSMAAAGEVADLERARKGWWRMGQSGESRGEVEMW